jgi:hypothetical protein
MKFNMHEIILPVEKIRLSHHYIIETSELLRRVDIINWRENLKQYSIVTLGFSNKHQNISLPPSLLIMYSDSIFIFPETFSTPEECYLFMNTIK